MRRISAGSGLQSQIWSVPLHVLRRAVVVIRGVVGQSIEASLVQVNAIEIGRAGLAPMQKPSNRPSPRHPKSSELGCVRAPSPEASAFEMNRSACVGAIHKKRIRSAGEQNNAVDVMAMNSDAETRHGSLWNSTTLLIDQPHFTLIVAFFSTVSEFSCYNPFTQHTPQFSQIVLAVSFGK